MIVFLSSFILNESAKWKVSEITTFENFPQSIEQNLINIGQKINFVDYTLMTNWGKIVPGFPTYNSFYSTVEDYYQIETFAQIKKDYDKEIFVSYNIDPMIAGYNELYIADGYFNIYDKNYKILFGEVIKDELTYIKNNERGWFYDYGPKLYLFYKMFYGSYNLDNINFCKLEKLPAIYMLSTIELESDSLKFDKQYNKIFIYKINPLNC